MLPVRTAPRRDPAPSRLRYRLNRLWLRPGVRRATNFGVPMLAGVLAAWTVMAQYDLRGHIAGWVEAAREAIVQRPQFTITEIAVPDVSKDLAEAIRVAAFVRLPASSLELDVNAVRDRIESLDAVERARVRALASGVLEIRAIERVPVVVWRSAARARAPRPERRARRRGRQPPPPPRPAADRGRGGRGARPRGAGAPRRDPARRRAAARPRAHGRAALGSRARPRPGGEAARGSIRCWRSGG